MKVVLTVGAMSVSCETDYRPDSSDERSVNGVARRALFERLLGVVSEKMREWMFKPMPDSADVLDLPPCPECGQNERTTTDEEVEAE